MIEIDLRDAAGGGVVAGRIPVHTRRSSKRLILLVHGYATSPREARRSYDSFTTNLLRVIFNSRLPLDTEIAAVHWPGDDVNWILSKLTFPSRVAEAANAGYALGRLVFDPQVDEIVVVAHSLGCRVALEYLRQFDAENPADRTQPPVSVALLMAAAVPTHHCDVAGLFRRTDGQGRREVVLFSKKDWVLQFALPIGNRAHSAGWSAAVGRTGGPKNRWDDSSAEYSLRHGEYWGSIDTSRKLVELLGEERDRRTESRISSFRHVYLRPSAGSRSRAVPSREAQARSPFRP